MLNYINKNGIKESVRDYSEEELNKIGVYGPFLKFYNGNSTRCCVLGDNSNLVINNKHVMPNTGKFVSSTINNNISIDLRPDTTYNFTLYSESGSDGQKATIELTDSFTTYGERYYGGFRYTKYPNGGAGGAGVYLSLIDVNNEQKYVAIGGGGGGRGSNQRGLFRGGLGGRVTFSINNIKHLDFFVLKGGAGGTGSNDADDPDPGAGGGGGCGGNGGRKGGGDSFRGGPGDNGQTINGLALGGNGVNSTDGDSAVFIGSAGGKRYYKDETNGKLLGPESYQSGKFGSNFLDSNTFSNIYSDSAYCEISYIY